MFDIHNLLGGSNNLDDGSEFMERNRGRKISASYNMLDELGKGSYGVVRRAQHKTSGNIFAVKQINKKAAGAKGLGEVFSEVEILSMLQHPSIVRLEEIFEDDSNLWLVMELVEGGELDAELRKHGRFPEATCRRIARSLLLGVEYIHRKGIVHRDLKPANMLVSGNFEDGNCDVKIADFGFSCVVSNESTLTSFCGTTAFMAPEILTDSPYGKPVDMWAVGVITYLLVYGRLPFTATDESGLIDTICRGELDLGNLPGSYGEFGVSEGVKDFIMRLLVVDSSLRMTATEGLHHYWVRGGNDDDEAFHYGDDDECEGNESEANRGRRHPRLRWKKALSMVIASHRLLYLLRCQQLAAEECDIPIARSFSFLISGHYEPPDGVVNVAGIATGKAIFRICDMVEASRTTETWDVASNSLSFDAVQVPARRPPPPPHPQNIVKVASGHPRLTALDLSNNPITGAGGRALLRLSRTGKLRILSLKGTGLPAEIHGQIEAALKEAAGKPVEKQKQSNLTAAKRQTGASPQRGRTTTPSSTSQHSVASLFNPAAGTTSRGRAVPPSTPSTTPMLPKIGGTGVVSRNAGRGRVK